MSAELDMLRTILSSEPFQQQVARGRARWVRRSGTAMLLVATLASPAWPLDPASSIDRYLLEEWDARDGLVSDSVSALAQTPDGYLWIGTAKGLMRFDGLRFTAVQGVGPPVSALAVDQAGALWVASGGRLIRRHARATREYPVSGEAAALLGDLRGGLWVGTGDGLQHWQQRDESWKQVGSHLPGMRISTIYEDGNGGLWVGTERHGLFRKRDGELEAVALELAGEEAPVHAVTEIGAGGILIAAGRGVTLVGDGPARPLVAAGAQPEAVVLLAGSDGNLWLGTAGRGLLRLRDGELESRLESSLVSCLLEDREGSLWVGTDGTGLKRLREGRFVTYALGAGAENDVLSLFQDRSGTVWVGTALGLFTSSGRGFTRWAGPGPAGVIASAEDENSLWLGTEANGLFRLRNGEASRLTSRSGLPSDTVLTITDDSRRGLWIGTDRGLVRLVDGEPTATAHHPLDAARIQCLHGDRQGRLWVGTDNGVFVVDRQLTPEEPLLAGSSISTILEGSEGTFWVGTVGQGLCGVSGGAVSCFTMTHGLSSDNIFGVVEDERGDLWLTSDEGVMRLNGRDLGKCVQGACDPPNVATFGLSDGLASLECSRHGKASAVSLRSGEIWVATGQGVAVVDPTRLAITRVPPPVVVESVHVGDRVLPTTASNVEFTQGPCIGFNFTSPTFIAPDEVTFRYKLEGLDSDWIELGEGARRYAHYHWPGPGEFRFRVIARNRDGVASESEATYAFQIVPRFYQTSSFRLLAALLLLGLAGGVYWAVRFRAARRLAEGDSRSSSLDPEVSERYLNGVRRAMEVDRAYRDPGLSLRSLAARLSVPHYLLSRVINEGFGKSFFDLVNGYRVEEAKVRLLAPDAESSALDIALAAGFNSQAAFYRAFRKFTGMSPTELRKQRRPGS